MYHGHHLRVPVSTEIDASAAAPRALEPPDPIDHRQMCAVAILQVGRIGLNPMLALAAQSAVCAAAVLPSVAGGPTYPFTCV